MKKRNKNKESDQPNLQRIRSEIAGVAKSERRLKFRPRGVKSKQKQTRKEKRKEERHLKKLRKLAYSQRKPIPTKLDLIQEKREKEAEDRKAANLKMKKAQQKAEKKRQARKQKMAEEERQRELEMADTYDDKIIREMEKKLKLNKRKPGTLPKSFIADGLDYILDVIDSDKLKELAESGELEDSDTEADRLALYGATNEGSDEDADEISNVVHEDSDDDSNAESEEDQEQEEGGDDEEEEEFSETENSARKELIQSKPTITKSSILKTTKATKIDKDTKVNKTVRWDIDDRKVLLSSKKRKKKESEENEDKIDISVKQKKGKRLKIEDENTNLDDDVGNIDLSDSENEENVQNSDSEEDDDYEDNSDGGDFDDDSLEENKLTTEASAVETEGLKEDIYGRLRDEEGNVVKPKTGAYVPPGKRLLMAGDDGKKKIQMERLSKQLKGLVNRASESNIQPVSSQIENLYLTNSRADVNETLISLMFESCITPVLTPERLAMELMMLVAILHGNIGSEVGAVFLQHLVKKFNDLYRLEAYGVGKEMDNVVVLLSHLYNFKIVHSVMIFDVVKKLLSSFNEKDVELILLILRNVGFSLRKDDPAGLKSLIQEVQSKASSDKAASLSDQSRVRFMLDVILAIRNNNMRKIPNYDPDHLEHLRKLIRNYIRGGHFGANQLHISLEDLLKADEHGKWWVVGSAWSGQGPSLQHESSRGEKSVIGGIEISSKLQELARKQRMNTDLRRNIFFIIMTSEDYIDAFEKLLRLGLKSSQQQEIVLVILNCCLHEKKYNPFYAYLGQKFCEHHRSYQMSFQFCVWDRFRELGSLSDSNRQNLGKLLTHLLATKALSLSIFKIVTFGTLEKPMVRLLKQILTDLLLEYPQSTTEAVFQRIAQLSKLKMLHEGLRLFLHHFILAKRKGDPNYAILKERLEIVDKIFSLGKSNMLL